MVERAKRVALVIVVLVLVVQAISIGSRGVAFANENMKPLLTQIVNTPDNPVPVEGTITGDVTVTGEVEVTNSPVVQAEQSGPWEVNVADGTLATKPQPATTSFNKTFFVSGAETLPQPIDASLVIVKFNNDKAEVLIKSQGETLFTVGTVHHAQTGDTVIPLTQPVRIDEVSILCGNDTLTCNSVDVWIIGDVAN